MNIFSLPSGFKLFCYPNICYFIYFQPPFFWGGEVGFLSISDLFLKVHSHACIFEMGGGGSIQILRFTGMCGCNGSPFHKKSLNPNLTTGFTGLVGKV